MELANQQFLILITGLIIPKKWKNKNRHGDRCQMTIQFI